MSEDKEPVWGFIDDGVITNIAVIFDLQVVAEHKKKHEDVIRLDEISPVPGVGWSYSKKNGFRPPKPFESWVWGDNFWEAPVSRPESSDSDNPEPYEWDEEALSWVVPQWWLDIQAEQQNEEEV